MTHGANEPAWPELSEKHRIPRGRPAEVAELADLVSGIPRPEKG